MHINEISIKKYGLFVIIFNVVTIHLSFGTTTWFFFNDCLFSSL
jgi:hypothetical protein